MHTQRLELNVKPLAETSGRSPWHRRRSPYREDLYLRPSLPQTTVRPAASREPSAEVMGDVEMR